MQPLIATPALRVLALVADVLNATHLEAGARWEATANPLSRAAREDGRLERVILWKVLESEAAVWTLADFTSDTADAILEHLNAINDEAVTAWYSTGLEAYEEPRPAPPGEPYVAILARAEFWRLADTTAKLDGLRL
ncbi:hypothetical protein ACIHFD_49845 [Nonomuraea sp. NPDC051941]|uniref:hypothetical protein n=1 Tax=Nonomuraea sp. NPDC051941 TaxID=3364373 RepID=UPI0037CBC3B7